MKEINNDLEKIVGGTSSISSAVINSFVNVIKLLIDAGKGVGSSVRRIAEGSMCPLE